MKMVLLMSGFFAFVTLACALRADAELSVGDMAPDVKFQGSDGKTYKIADFRGKQAVVIAFFPKAFTGG